MSDFDVKEFDDQPDDLSREVVEPLGEPYTPEQAKQMYRDVITKQGQRQALSVLFKAWVPMLLDTTITPTAVWDEFQELAVPFTLLMPFPDGAAGSCAKYLMEKATSVLIMPRPVTSNGQRHGSRYKPTAAAMEDFKVREAKAKAWKEWMLNECKGEEPR